MDNHSFSSSPKHQIEKLGVQLRPRITDMEKYIKDNKRAYVKVPQSVKAELFRMVFKDGRKIKSAARDLRIKYATAKTIIFHQREKRKAVNVHAEKQCSYTELIEEKEIKYTIVSNNANDTVNSQEYTFIKKATTPQVNS